MGNPLRARGFLPYLATIFLNAFVDLGHKITIQNTLFKTFDGNSLIIYTAIVNALILLPFVLLFTPAGFLADKFPKNRVMRTTAWGVVGLTAMITLCYYQGWFRLAFFMTFLLALQSAVYSPAKFGYIKEIVGKERLARANGLVQATTTTAILGGTFAFSILFELFLTGASFTNEQEVLQAIAPIGWFLIAGGIIELILAYRLPDARQTNQELRFDWRRYRSGAYLVENVSLVMKRRIIIFSIITLAMIWAIGQVMLAAFPAFVKQHLDILDARVVQGMLACAGIGIIIGSVIAGRISRNYIESALIPVGALGVATCLLVLPGLPGVAAHVVNMLLIGMFSGLIIIPLHALIQFHAGEHIRGRALAVNNLIQNLIMLSFLALTVLVSLLQVSHLLFPLLTLVALGSGCYILSRMPQSLARFLVIPAGARRTGLQVQGFNHIPESGGVLLLGRRSNPGDWALLQMLIPRPVRFVTDSEPDYPWPLKRLFRLLGRVRVQDATAPVTFDRVAELIGAGEVVCPWLMQTTDTSDWLKRWRAYMSARAAATDALLLPFDITGSKQAADLSDADACRDEAQSVRTGRRQAGVAVTFGATRQLSA